VQVRLTPESAAIADRLRSQLGVSRARIVEQALKKLDEDIFWAEVTAAYARGESLEQKAERLLWEVVDPPCP
jgi:hypothetical protein